MLRLFPHDRSAETYLLLVYFVERIAHFLVVRLSLLLEWWGYKKRK